MTAPIPFSKNLKLRSDLNEVDRIVKLLEEIGETYQFDKERLSHSVIAITEALTNAIRHGNNLNASKEILFHIYLDSTWFKVTIEDEGEGFVESELPDPLAPENLLKNSGRGVFLIRSLMDEVTISSSTKGTQIRLQTAYKKSVKKEND